LFTFPRESGRIRRAAKLDGFGSGTGYGYAHSFGDGYGYELNGDDDGDYDYDCLNGIYACGYGDIHGDGA